MPLDQICVANIAKSIRSKIFLPALPHEFFPIRGTPQFDAAQSIEERLGDLDLDDACGSAGISASSPLAVSNCCFFLRGPVITDEHGSKVTASECCKN